jgi:outer membrane protein assembly factor BamE (lipoprotein component of BamABCDE complex)
MKKYFAVALIASMFAATGCTTMGDQSLTMADQASVDRYIVDGKTTMAEVRAVFGDTKSKEQTKAGGELWYYSAVNHRIVTATVKTLAVTFDRKGVVTSHRYGETSPNVATSLR